MAKQTSKKVTITSTYAGTDASVEAIGLAYRAIYNDTYEPDLPDWITAQQIYDAVLPVAGETPDADEVRADAINALLPAWEEAHASIEQAKEDIATVQITAQKGNPVAKASGAKFSPELNAALDDIANIKEQWDGAPLMLREEALKVFDVEEILSWPLPGSRYDAEETSGVDKDGNPIPNPKHPGYDWNVKEGSNRPLRDPDFYWDRAKDTKSSFYVDQINNSHNGTVFFRTNELIEKAATAFTSMSIEERKELVTLTGYTADDLQAEATQDIAKDRNKKRRTSEVGKWRTMVAFIQKCAEIEHELPATGWLFMRDKNSRPFPIEQLCTMNKPLRLAIKAKNDKTGNWEFVDSTPPISVSDFCKLNVAKAKAAGGTAGDLKSTVGKRAKRTEEPTAQGGGKDKEGTGIGAVTNVRQAESTMNQLVAFFDEDTTETAMMKWLAKASDEQVTTIAELRSHVARWYKLVEKRHASILANENASKEQQPTVMDQLKKSVANA